MAKAYTLAALTVCPVESAPRVEVVFSAEKPFYSQKHDSASLKLSMSKDKESTLATDKRAVVFGATTSVTGGITRVSFKTKTDRSGNQCIYVDKAVFWLDYRPAIFISSDILDMECSYKTTLAHEKQHVAIDIKAIQDYIPYIKVDMLLYLKSIGYQGFGPYNKSELPKHKERLLKSIVKAGQPMIEKLREARRRRQGLIDTEENYRREAAKCPQDRELIAERFHGKR